MVLVAWHVLVSSEAQGVGLELVAIAGAGWMFLWSIGALVATARCRPDRIDPAPPAPDGVGASTRT